MLFRRGRFNRELQEELAAHLAEREADYIREGLTPAEARRRAVIDFGNPAVVHEQSRDVWLVRWLDTLVRDARIALRGIRSTPAFSAAVIATLGLGIGANTAMFTVVDAALLRPLPYAEADRLVMIGDAGADGLPANFGFETIQDLRTGAPSLDAVEIVRSWSPAMVVDGVAERVQAMRVSHGYLDLLGVRPALGRLFTADEDRPGQWRVLVISDALWKRRFGSDPSIVGRTLLMQDREYRIVGVLPAGFEPLISDRFYKAAEMWAPLGYAIGEPGACRSCQHLRAVGRLAPGVVPASATAQLNTLRAQLRERFPDDYDPGRIAVQPLRDALAGPVRRAVLVLFAAVALVLLIACANVANLFLSRAISRRGEMALRFALGAGRGRIASQVIVEALTLGVAGGMAGTALAAALLESAATLAPAALPRADQIGLDARMLTFAFAISIVTGAAFGLLPAWRASSTGLRDAMGTGSRGAAGGRGGRARNALVVVDVALALLLLTGAGLMVRSVGRLLTVDPGFDPDGVVTLQFSLVGAKWAGDGPVRAFQRELIERVEAIPGVAGAALSGQVPLGGNYDTWGVRLREPRPRDAAPLDFQRFSVTPSYARLLGIPLKRGRFIEAIDTFEAAPVAVLSESAAEATWPGEDPIGKQFQIGGPESRWRTVVGITGNVRHLALGEKPDLQMYLPQEQVTDSFLVLSVRSAGPAPESLIGPARDAIRAIDATVPVYEVHTYDALIAKSTAAEQFVMRILGAFAVMALLLAAVGLYGVVAYAVANRQRELAVRLALGARPGHLMSLVFASGGVAIAAGVALGLVASYLATGLLGSLLHGVEAADPIVTAEAVGLLLAVAALAHAIPLRRAMRLSPAVALKKEV